MWYRKYFLLFIFIFVFLHRPKWTHHVTGYEHFPLAFQFHRQTMQYQTFRNAFLWYSVDMKVILVCIFKHAFHSIDGSNDNINQSMCVITQAYRLTLVLNLSERLSNSFLSLFFSRSLFFSSFIPSSMSLPLFIYLYICLFL